MSRFPWLAAVLTLFIATAQAASDSDDPAMLKLASRSGCLTCHSIKPVDQEPNGAPPIGPAWGDVATRYRAVPGALDEVTRTVLSGSSPRHSFERGRRPSWAWLHPLIW